MGCPSGESSWLSFHCAERCQNVLQPIFARLKLVFQNICIAHILRSFENIQKSRILVSQEDEGALCRMYIEYWLVVTAAGARHAFYCSRKGKILLNEFDNTKYNLNHKWSGGGGKNYLLVALNPQPIPGPSLVIFRPQKAFCFFNISLPPRSKKITKRTLWSSYPPPQIMFWLCEKNYCLPHNW